MRVGWSSSTLTEEASDESRRRSGRGGRSGGLVRCADCGVGLVRF